MYLGLGQTNPYIGSLEARVYASNKERVYGLVCPNLYLVRKSTNMHFLIMITKSRKVQFSILFLLILYHRFANKAQISLCTSY
jgi:hypothetical protein